MVETHGHVSLQIDLTFLVWRRSNATSLRGVGLWKWDSDFFCGWAWVTTRVTRTFGFGVGVVCGGSGGGRWVQCVFTFVVFLWICRFCFFGLFLQIKKYK